uniref:GDNF/GAS1 domain-containing protein n=1 Tax=Strigamia maritima TaxID=126957 RepID=T1JNB5_STRMM
MLKDPTDRVVNENYPGCTYAYNLCYHNIKCKKIFDYFRRLCRVEDDQCAMRDRGKCHRAWTKVQLTPVYGCLCHEDAELEKCAKIYSLVNNNPCVEPELPELYTASHKLDEGVTALVTDLDGNIPFPLFDYDDPDEVHNVNPVVSALHGELVGLYGHSNIIGSRVDERLPALPPDVFPSMSIKAKSTCPKAHEVCVADLTCQVLLDNMLQVCDMSRTPCNRTECMGAVRNFYELGNPDITHSVAFCICRYNDPACLIQQQQLHPPCAQRPENEIPGCYQVATQCRSKPECRWRMDQFITACAVDQNTIQCQGPLHECRNALINILGTRLRTNCACSGNDFSLLYSCIDWQRLIWLNPCVVQAQKEYHEIKISTPSPIPIKQTQRTAVKIIKNLFSTTGKNSGTTNGPHPTPMPWIPNTKPESLDPNTCVMTSGGVNTVYIHEGLSQRIYEADNPDCSMLCLCNRGGYTTCQQLVCPEKISCRSSQAVYSHSFRSYRAFRGHCTCFSGNFICAKPDEGYDLNPGVYFFLGYSKVEEASVNNFTNMTISNSVHELQKLLDSQEKACRMSISHVIGENVIIQIYLNDFTAERQDNSITPEMVMREDEVCRSSLKT